MSERRFAKFGIAALEQHFDANRQTLDELQSLGAELTMHRSSRRAKALLERVVTAIAVLPKQTTGV
jgi:hypothetical protein